MRSKRNSSGDWNNCTNRASNEAGSSAYNNITSNLADWIVDGNETALLSHHYQICDIIEKSVIVKKVL